MWIWRCQICGMEFPHEAYNNGAEVLGWHSWGHVDSGNFLILALERGEEPFDEVLVCPECRQDRPDDDRVLAGMKCGPCAYGV